MNPQEEAKRMQEQKRRTQRMRELAEHLGVDVETAREALRQVVERSARLLTAIRRAN